jgi:hypothetical protein
MVKYYEVEVSNYPSGERDSYINVTGVIVFPTFVEIQQAGRKVYIMLNRLISIVIEEAKDEKVN